nr:unknown unsecreted protein [Papilio xuthus]
MLIRIHHRGVLELDTAMLKRKMCNSPLTVIGEKEKPVFLLGFDAHHLYLRHSECADVLSWDIQKPYSNLINIHSAGPQMVPTSVTSDPLKYSLLVLDTNYAETVLETKATYHKLTFIGQV